MKRALILMAPLTWFGCGADSSGGSSVEPEGSSAVIQSGPQDIGEFRAIVEGGGVPSLDVLDERGFFAEHKIDLPAADCGASVCVHPMLAVAPRFDGGNWAMAFVGMNTAFDAASLPARPRHLVLVGTPPNNSAEILKSTLDSDDLVSVVRIGDQVDVPARGENVDALVGPSLPVDGAGVENPPLYAGLVEALDIVSDDEFAGYARRLLVFGSESGLGPSEALDPYEDIAQAFAELDVPITVFASEPDELSHLLTEVTWGNYYFAKDARDLTNAFRVEADTAFVPIAKNLTITVEAAEGYEVGTVYGAPRAKSNGEVAVLESPVAYIGARRSSDDLDTGRRGGGGGWFVQLLSDRDPTGNDYEDADAFTLIVDYDDAVTGEAVHDETTLVTPLGVGQNPPPQEPFFSDTERGKPFMMLNMYMALSATTMLANDNQCGSALSIEPMMTQAWEIFTALYPDRDIDSDFALLKALTANIRAQCQQPPDRYIPLPASCGYI